MYTQYSQHSELGGNIFESLVQSSFTQGPGQSTYDPSMNTTEGKLQSIGRLSETPKAENDRWSMAYDASPDIAKVLMYEYLYLFICSPAARTSNPEAWLCWRTVLTCSLLPAAQSHNLEPNCLTFCQPFWELRRDSWITGLKTGLVVS